MESDGVSFGGCEQESDRFEVREEDSRRRIGQRRAGGSGNFRSAPKQSARSARIVGEVEDEREGREES